MRIYLNKMKPKTKSLKLITYFISQIQIHNWHLVINHKASLWPKRDYLVTINKTRLLIKAYPYSLLHKMTLRKTISIFLEILYSQLVIQINRNKNPIIQSNLKHSLILLSIKVIMIQAQNPHCSTTTHRQMPFLTTRLINLLMAKHSSILTRHLNNQSKKKRFFNKSHKQNNLVLFLLKQSQATYLVVIWLMYKQSSHNCLHRTTKHSLHKLTKKTIHLLRKTLLNKFHSKVLHRWLVNPYPKACLMEILIIFLVQLCSLKVS